jgi:hypothetical protein
MGNWWGRGSELDLRYLNLDIESLVQTEFRPRLSSPEVHTVKLLDQNWS